MLLMSMGLVFLCTTDSFASINESPIIQRGFNYALHSLGGITLLSITVASAAVAVRSQKGVRRLELQYLALSTGIAGLLVVILNSLGNLLHLRPLNRASIFVVFAAYLFMAWALAHRRIFNAGQVLLSVSQRIAVAGIMTASAWALAGALVEVLEPAPAWLASVFACGLGAFWLDQQTRRWLGLDSTRPLELVRAELIEGTREGNEAGDLIHTFESTIARHFSSSAAFVLVRRDDSFLGHDIVLPVRQPGFSLLCEEGWTTPESLQRRRQIPDLVDLGAFLETHTLAVLVTAPTASLAPTILIGLGTKTNEAPFTFPEVQRLQNVADLVDSLLAHSSNTNQLVMQARLDHLALTARGLAHDLKNLLLPVTEFLAQVGSFLPQESREAQLHAEAARTVEIMGDYLRDTLFFSKQLKPKLAPVDFSRLLEAVQSASRPRAEQREVAVEPQQGTFPALIGDQSLLQRLLTNLVANAIDASAQGQVVRISVSESAPGWVRLAVQDEGHGMSAETISRIFDPYFTTKDRASDNQGVGLGLTISQTIVHLHEGRFEVESHPGRGTVMNVHLPAVPEQLVASSPSA